MTAEQTGQEDIWIDRDGSAVKLENVYSHDNHFRAYRITDPVELILAKLRYG